MFFFLLAPHAKESMTGKEEKKKKEINYLHRT
jgi:hypothetical protein